MHLFLTVLEAGSVRSGCQHGRVMGRALLWVNRWLPSPCVLTWLKGDLRALWSPFIRALTPLMRAPLHDLITSKRVHLLTPSPWELGFQHTNYGSGVGGGHTLQWHLRNMKIYSLSQSRWMVRNQVYLSYPVRAEFPKRFYSSLSSPLGVFLDIFSYLPCEMLILQIYYISVYILWPFEGPCNCNI